MLKAIWVDGAGEVAKGLPLLDHHVIRHGEAIGLLGDRDDCPPVAPDGAGGKCGEVGVLCCVGADGACNAGCDRLRGFGIWLHGL